MSKKEQKQPKSGSKIQDQFMARMKQALRPGIGMAEELADLLDVSIDSAYRRIRGETELTLEEAYKISRKYNIGVDEIFGSNSGRATFTYTKLTDSAQNFEEYLLRIIGHLKAINKFSDGHLYYVAEEVPIFYSFYSKRLTEFKLFYWQRSVLNVADFQNVKFDWGIVPQVLVDIAHDSFKEYLNSFVTEVWSNETVFTGLRQIGYYFDTGIVSRDHALELLAEYRKMLEMVNRNAEAGRKNISDKSDNYILYNSEVVLGTNCIYITAGGSKYSYISFNTLNSITTSNVEFCEETEHWLKNIEKKSTLISGVAEKQRYAFFNKMYRHVDNLVEHIKNS